MIEALCLECNATFKKQNYESKKFCSRSCAATNNNKKFPKRKVEGKCKLCFKSISTQKRFCSEDCKLNFKIKNLKLDLKPNNQAVIEWRQRLKIRAVEYKGGSCSKCNYSKCIAALEFHHLDPNEKDFGIGSGDIKAWKKVKIELDKCIILCANCHREEHEKIRGQGVNRTHFVKDG